MLFPLRLAVRRDTYGRDDFSPNGRHSAIVNPGQRWVKSDISRKPAAQSGRSGKRRSPKSANNGEVARLTRSPCNDSEGRTRHKITPVQARKDSRPVATGSIIALGKVASRAVAIRMQIADSHHNTKMFRRPKPGIAGSL
jgi:hypothetical protein